MSLVVAVLRGPAGAGVRADGEALTAREPARTLLSFSVIFRSRLHSVPRVFGVVQASVEHWFSRSPLH